MRKLTNHLINSLDHSQRINRKSDDLLACDCQVTVFPSSTGQAEAAMVTALYVKLYEDLLNAEDVYCLLACASAACKAFGTCSRAFMKLESLDSVSTVQNCQYCTLLIT